MRSNGGSKAGLWWALAVIGSNVLTNLVCQDEAQADAIEKALSRRAVRSMVALLGRAK